MTGTPLAKVPQVTLAFWIIKVLATTLGETGGDAVSMSMGLGYLVGSAIFAVPFALVVAVQIRTVEFRPLLYWAAIIASTMLGTTLADYVDRSIGIGYPGGSALLLAMLLASLFAWKRVLGSVAVATVSNPTSQRFYWLAILFSQTLGTALGDWMVDASPLGYAGGIVLFGAALLGVAVLYATRRASRTVLFWMAFILTRPFGAVVGDFLDKPLADGGLALSRYGASLVLLLAILACIVLIPQKPASMPGHPGS